MGAHIPSRCGWPELSVGGSGCISWFRSISHLTDFVQSLHSLFTFGPTFTVAQSENPLFFSTVIFYDSDLSDLTYRFHAVIFAVFLLSTRLSRWHGKNSLPSPPLSYSMITVNFSPYPRVPCCNLWSVSIFCQTFTLVHRENYLFLLLYCRILWFRFLRNNLTWESESWLHFFLHLDLLVLARASGRFVLPRSYSRGDGRDREVSLSLCANVKVWWKVETLQRFSTESVGKLRKWTES